jgi:tol-pal system protein YbgF
MRRFVIAACVLAATPSAWAANKDIERLQIQIASLQGQVADVLRALEDSHREIRRLNEQLAELNASGKKGWQDERAHAESLQTALREVQERLAEVSERVEAVRVAQPGLPPADTASAPSGTVPSSNPAVSSPTGTPAAPQPTGPPPAPRELYSQAYADFARGNYDLAIQGFTEYLRAYPNTDFSDNAQYWIGECLYGKQKFQDAVAAWDTLFRDFASSDKLPDARVKKGMALEKLGRRGQALLEYRLVVDRFPNSSAARIARERLNP